MSHKRQQNLTASPTFSNLQVIWLKPKPLPDEVDYRALLLKYIQHVDDEGGGVTHLRFGGRSDGITPVEWGVLLALDKERAKGEP